jgi:plastocyanin
MKTVVIVVVVLLLLGGGFFLFTNANKSKTTVAPSPTMAMENTMQMTPTVAMNEGASGSAAPSGTMSGNVKEFTVTGQPYSFTPNTLTVTKGDKVKITFKNTKGMHDFVIDELHVKTPVIQTGEDASVEFTADKPGTYKYYCSVGNHRQMGMEGTLTVK